MPHAVDRPAVEGVCMAKFPVEDRLSQVGVVQSQVPFAVVRDVDVVSHKAGAFRIIVT